MTNIVQQIRLANEIALNHAAAGRNILPGLVRDIAQELGSDSKSINLLMTGITKETTDEGILEILLDIEREERYEQLKEIFRSDRFADRPEDE